MMDILIALAQTALHGAIVTAVAVFLAAGAICLMACVGEEDADLD